MEEWQFLFDLLYRYLGRCHETWEVLQKLRERASYPECCRRFVDTVLPAIHRYAILFRMLALKQLEKDGRSFIVKRWVSETRSILEEFHGPINRLKLVEIKGGIELNVKPPWQVSLVESADQEVLYDRSSSSKPFKRVRFDTVAVEVLPELVPDLPQTVVAYEVEDLQDNSEMVVNPFYFQM